MRSGLILGLLLAALPGSALARSPYNLTAVNVTAPATRVAEADIQITGTFSSDSTSAPPSFFWTAYLTSDGSLEGAVPIATFGPVTLGAQETVVRTETASLPPATTGHYRVAIAIDPSNAILERNEYDNTKVADASTRIRAPAPDFRITEASMTVAAGRSGEPMDVSITLQNGGEEAATITVAAYLSEDVLPATSDELVGVAQVTLNPGQSGSTQLTGVVPAIDAGDYSVVLIVDPAALVTEISETNNTYVVETYNVYSDTLTLDTETLPDGALDIDYHLVLKSSGGNGHYNYRVSTGFLPWGVYLDQQTGILSGTPYASGTHDFEITVMSNGLTASRSYNISIARSISQLTIATNHATDGALYMPYEQILVAGGGEPPYHWRLKEAAGVLPPGLDLTSAGVISGIPNTPGSFTFAVEVEDQLGVFDWAEYTVEVHSIANVTILLNTPPPAPAGEPMDFALVAMGGRAPYTWEAVSTPPPGLSITEQGHIVGAPTEIGRWPVRVRATDSTRRKASDTALIQVTVVEAGPFEIDVRSLAPATVRTKYEVIFTATGGLPPLSWRIVPGDTPPAGFYFVEGDGDDDPEDTARFYGIAFRPVTHAFSVRVEDAYGRRREVPLVLNVERPPDLTSSGCVCLRDISPSWTGSGLLLLGLLLFRRRRA